MKIKSSLYPILFVLACALAVIGISLTYPRLDLKLFPIMVSGIVVILAVIQAAKELQSGSKNGGETEPGVEGGGTERPERRRCMLIGAWVLGLILAVSLVGVIGGIFLFVLCYLKSVGHGWRLSLGAATTFTGLIYIVFVLALRLELYRGLLFGAPFY